MQLKLSSHGQINWIQFLGFKKFDPVLTKLWQFTNLVPRAIFKKYFLFRLPLLAKRCAGVEVDNSQHQFSGNVKEVWYFPGTEFKRTLICCKFVENDVFIKFLMTLFTVWCNTGNPSRYPLFPLLPFIRPELPVPQVPPGPPVYLVPPRPPSCPLAL